MLDPEVEHKMKEQSLISQSGSSIKSQVLDLKTLPIFSPLKISVIVEVKPVKSRITENKTNFVIKLIRRLIYGNRGDAALEMMVPKVS